MDPFVLREDREYLWTAWMGFRSGTSPTRRLVKAVVGDKRLELMASSTVTGFSSPME